MKVNGGIRKGQLREGPRQSNCTDKGDIAVDVGVGRGGGQKRELASKALGAELAERGIFYPWVPWMTHMGYFVNFGSLC